MSNDKIPNLAEILREELEVKGRLEEIKKAYQEADPKQFARSGLFGGISGGKKNKALSDIYTKEEIQTWFTDPDTYEKELRDLSRYLYVSKGLYYTALNFYTNLLTLDFNIVPMFNIVESEYESIMRSKNAVTDYCEDILNKPFLRSVIKAVLKDGAYYGYERKANSTFYMQRLLNDYAREGSLVNGLPSIEFDFSFFDDNESALDGYGSEFQKKYNIYKNDEDQQWQVLDTNKTMCIPLESDDFNFPALTGILDDMFDLDDFYKYMKDSIEMDTEKVVVQKPPMNEETGKMLVSPSDIKFFQDALSYVFDERYKVVSTPFELDTIDFTKNKMSNSAFDGVEKMKDATWNGTGIAKPIFGEADSASGLKINYEVNANYVFAIIEKIEVWLKQRLSKVGTKKYRFKVEFLRSTNVYRQEAFDMQYKLFAAGGALKPLIASAGMNPDSYIRMLQMENMEGIKDHLIVPQSMHTQPSDEDKGGAPTKGDDAIGDEGETTRDTDGNDR